MINGPKLREIALYYLGWWMYQCHFCMAEGTNSRNLVSLVQVFDNHLKRISLLFCPVCFYFRDEESEGLPASVLYNCSSFFNSFLRLVVASWIPFTICCTFTCSENGKFFASAIILDCLWPFAMYLKIPCVFYLNHQLTSF